MEPTGPPVNVHQDGTPDLGSHICIANTEEPVKQQTIPRSPRGVEASQYGVGVAW